MPPGEDTGHYHEFSALYIANTCQYITRYTGCHSGDQLFCQDWTNIVNYWHYTISHLLVCQDWTNVGSYWHTRMPVVPVYASLIPVLARKVPVYWGAEIHEFAHKCNVSQYLTPETWTVLTWKISWK